jgi:glycosyltransferase involved in cell wall biosynthesis
MRVALVSGGHLPARDGVTDYTQRLRRELSQVGVSATVVSMSGDDTAEPWPQRQELPQLLLVKGSWNLRGVWSIARTLQRLPVDLIHVQFAPSAFSWHGQIGLLPLLSGARKPILTTLHEYDWWSWPPHGIAALLRHTLWPVTERLGLWDRECALLTPRSRLTIVTNPSHRAALLRRMPRVQPQLISIGPNVPRHRVDAQETRRWIRRRWGLRSGAQILTFFGFIHAVKGIRYLIAAVADLKHRWPDLHLALVGGFESLALPAAEASAYRKEIEALISHYGLGDRVTITGWLSEREVSQILTASDIAALPFTAGTTTRSGAVLTCAEHGLPLVATRGGASDGAIIDGDNAVLVPVRDASALTVAIESVLNDPALAARLRRGAQRLAEGHSWPSIALRHRELYERALTAATRQEGVPLSTGALQD